MKVPVAIVAVIAALALTALVALGAARSGGDDGGARVARAAATTYTTSATTPSPVPTLPPGPIGFGQPTVLSHTRSGHEIDDAHVAVSPTGSTAVMWRDASGFRRGETFRADYLVSIGPDASHLSAPRPIVAAREAAKVTGDAQLLARPDGGFVACFNESGQRHGTATSGCSFAKPGGRFGPLRVVLREPWNKRSTMQPAVRADGTVLVVITHPAGKSRHSVAVARLTPAGRLTTLQSLGNVTGSSIPSLATTTDGTVAVAWSNGPEQEFEPVGTPVVRVMPPGATRFGAPVAFPERSKISDGLNVSGGAALLVQYSTAPLSDGAEQRIARLLPNGRLSSPKTLPRPGNGFVSGYAIPLLDGTPLAITSSDVESESDCGNSTGGSVGVGPLVDLPSRPSDDDSDETGPVTATPLSDPKQIAQYATAALLADGTVIVAWSDSFGRDGQSRVEVASRRPGDAAFSAPQVLPRDTVYGGQSLGTGGNQALLAWTVGARGTRTDVVVSALRTAPPFATQQPRPTNPGTSCS